MNDIWAAGDAYEPYVGRWSRLVAAAFLDWLDVPAGRRWVELGCGTGALTQGIVSRGEPADVLAIDPSEGFIGWARSRVDDPRVTFTVGDVSDLGSGADVVVSGLVLNFLPDPAAAVSAMRAAGSLVAAYVWDYAGRMELMRYFWDAAAELDPSAAALDEGIRFPVCEPEALQGIWHDAGLVDVTCRAIDVPTVFEDFEDYWRPFLGGQGPAPGYAMSLEEDRRGQLRDLIRSRLPDGAIALNARAWAIRGSR